jgi:hypothetical protein
MHTSESDGRRHITLRGYKRGRGACVMHVYPEGEKQIWWTPGKSWKHKKLEIYCEALGVYGKSSVRSNTSHLRFCS